MNRRRPFVRKLIYFAVIAVLLVPLSWLSQPAATGTGVAADGRRTGGSAGGHLAQLRKEYKLSQANLGEIDPTSEALKLATLGMRGVAANILWTKANHYKKVEDWTNMSATCNQIVLLQPNFVAVWNFQAWNIAYNVSAEFDGYRDRYEKVKEGIRFLIKGIAYNDRDPRMLTYVAYFISNKMGDSDERRQFRPMFADDTDFHDQMRADNETGKIGISFVDTHGPTGKPDSWLVSRQWYLQAERLVELLIDEDPHARIPLGRHQIRFYEDAPKRYIDFANAIEEEGHFGKVARSAWQQAEVYWRAYGDRPLRLDEGHVHRLNELDQYQTQLAELEKQLDALDPKARQQLRQERLKTLGKPWQDAVKVPPDQRTRDQRELAEQAEKWSKPVAREIAAKITGERADEAIGLADKATAVEDIVREIESGIERVAYDMWLDRCQVEGTDDALLGRELIYQAYRQYANARLDSDDENNPGAKQLFERGFAAWAPVFEQNPRLYDHVKICDDLIRAATLYRDKILDARQWPDDFPLLEFLQIKGEVMPSQVRAEKAASGETKKSNQEPIPKP